MVLWSQELFTEKFFGEPEWFFYDIAVKKKKFGAFLKFHTFKYLKND